MIHVFHSSQSFECGFGSL